MRNVLDDERISIGDECEVYRISSEGIILMGKAIVVEIPTRISDTYSVVYTEPNSTMIRVGRVAVAYPNSLVRTGRKIKYEMIPCEIKED